MTPGPAKQLAFSATGEPVATAAAGQDFAASPNTVVVDAEDALGNVVTSYSGPVTIGLANGASGDVRRQQRPDGQRVRRGGDVLQAGAGHGRDVQAVGDEHERAGPGRGYLELDHDHVGGDADATGLDGRAAEQGRRPGAAGGDGGRRGPVRQPDHGLRPGRHDRPGPQRQGRQRRPGRDDHGGGVPRGGGLHQHHHRYRGESVHADRQQRRLHVGTLQRDRRGGSAVGVGRRAAEPGGARLPVRCDGGPAGPVRQAGDVVQWKYHGGPGQQSQGGPSGRDGDDQGDGGCGELHGPDDRRDRRGLHAASQRSRRDLAGVERDRRDADPGVVAGGDGAAAGVGGGESGVRAEGDGAGRQRGPGPGLHGERERGDHGEPGEPGPGWHDDGGGRWPAWRASRA